MRLLGRGAVATNVYVDIWYVTETKCIAHSVAVPLRLTRDGRHEVGSEGTAGNSLQEIKENTMDHIDAIAVAVDALGAKLGEGLERRGKASAIEHALNLAGYVIVPKFSPEALMAENMARAKKIEQEIDETRESIRMGARRATKRFRP